MSKHCLRCNETSSYRYTVGRSDFLCPSCCAVVDPERFMHSGNDTDRTELELARSHAQYFDHEWEAMGWKKPATVHKL